MRVLTQFQSFLEKKDLNRVLSAHILRSVALSMIAVYIPVLLLENGQSLQSVILFYGLAHLSGLLAVFLIIVPLIKKYGTVRVFKLYYPLEITFFILLNIFVATGNEKLIWVAAILTGVGNFAYWIPHNILFLRNSKKDSMGNDLSTFFCATQNF